MARNQAGPRSFGRELTAIRGRRSDGPLSAYCGGPAGPPSDPCLNGANARGVRQRRWRSVGLRCDRVKGGRAVNDGRCGGVRRGEGGGQGMTCVTAILGGDAVVEGDCATALAVWAATAHPPLRIAPHKRVGCAAATVVTVDKKWQRIGGARPARGTHDTRAVWQGWQWQRPDEVGTVAARCWRIGGRHQCCRVAPLGRNLWTSRRLGGRGERNGCATHNLVNKVSAVAVHPIGAVPRFLPAVDRRSWSFCYDREPRCRTPLAVSSAESKRMVRCVELQRDNGRVR